MWQNKYPSLNYLVALNSEMINSFCPFGSIFVRHVFFSLYLCFHQIMPKKEVKDGENMKWNRGRNTHNRRKFKTRTNQNGIFCFIEITSEKIRFIVQNIHTQCKATDKQT